jgi:hypothetical protein
MFSEKKKTKKQRTGSVCFAVNVLASSEHRLVECVPGTNLSRLPEITTFAASPLRMFREKPVIV